MRNRVLFSGYQPYVSPMPHHESTQAIKSAIRQRALALGFDTVGFAAAPAPPEQGKALAAFLADGRHGDMEWMATTESRRASPSVLWPEARSAVVVGLNYGPAMDPLAVLERREQGAISAYAQTGRDYHDVVKKKLRQLARWIADNNQCDVKLFVDTAPVMEKPLAARAGLGWQGKHTNLVSRSHGSWLFLGEVLTTLNLPPDAPETDHCGTCCNCLNICPTAAFPAPYQLDARRCIAYLTIEHAGHIPVEFRRPIGNRVFGCDDCLAVCPWNKFAQRARDAQMRARVELAALDLADLAALDDPAFRQVFAQSPIKRLGRDRFLRNVLIAIGNSGSPSLAGAARAHLSDPSPLVRAMAVWAMAQLLSPEAFAGLAAELQPAETDSEVREEWRAGLASGRRLGEDCDS